MRNKPEHTCFNTQCPACAFELGQQLANKTTQNAKYIWMVINSNTPCDIRRYAFSHEEAMAQLSHTKNFKDKATQHGEWVLFKLVRVKRRK